jgi:putative ABC transport system ATP-binding protein
MNDCDRDNGDPLLRVDCVSRIFRMGEVEVPALIEVELSVVRGEFLVIVGPSGSGKSTLLNLIGGMDQPSSGHIWHGGTDLAAVDEACLTRYRRERVGFVFQFYNLVPTLTAYENVQVATELVAEPLAPEAALELVSLGDRANHFPAQLSGGEQQRVAIARALAKQPELLLADEPTGALDLETSRSVLGILQNLSRERGLTILLITHNRAIAGIAHRIARIVSGRIAETMRNERVVPAEKITW